MKGVKKCFGALLVFFIIFGLSLSVYSDVNAYTFFSSFNITSLSYYINSTTGNPIVQNSINNYATTPIISDTITGNYYSILRPTFTLNKDANLSKTQRMYLAFEIITKTTYAGGDIYANTYFSCPRNYEQLRVASCIIRDSDKTIIGQYTEVDTPTQGENDTWAFQSEKNYLVELELYYNSDTPVAVRELTLAGRLLSVSKNTSGPTLPIGFNWQINYNSSNGFYYEDPNAAAQAIEEQNRKDDQDRSNMNNQQSTIESDAEDSSDDASSTGTTLLGAFSSFVTAITSASPSNCKINMDMGNLNLGLVDFCTLSPPPAFQTIASIFLILFCVPLSIATARKVISLFRSFQG